MSTENLHKYRTTSENENTLIKPERGTEYSQMINSLYDTLPDLNEHLIDDRNLYQEVLTESASGLQSEWILPFKPVNKESLFVFISGVYQTNYELNDYTLSFSENLPLGSKLSVFYIKEN